MKVTVCETLPDVAVMDKDPAAMPDTRPVSETVAVEVAPDDQMTEEVMFWVVPSE